VAQAVKLLAVRGHFRLELERKLVQRGYEPDEIAAAFAELERRRYLDDGAAARAYVRSRLTKGLGRSRLQAELAARGVTGELAREVLTELVPADDTEAARAVAARTFKKDPAALGRSLARKGFSGKAIRVVVGEWDGE
jgi:regulatory protein